MNSADIKMPKKLVPVFQGEYRYRGAYGGRGSGKTRTFATMTAVRGYMYGMSGVSGQILCGREYMNSLAESSFEEVKGAILGVPWLNDYYECGQNFIRSKDNRIQFVFAGLRHNLDSIKSKARILLAWIDEADSVSEEAWRKLIPTVREEGSEIWVTWNPEIKNSPTDIRFRQQADDSMKIVEMNWRDNPYFPKTLELERQRDQELRPETYDHVWEGDYLEIRDGAYYLDQFKAVNKEGRITELPIKQDIGCITCWDIGRSDGTAIFVAQKLGEFYHIIDFYESWGKPYSHATQWLQSSGYTYSQMLLPHDAGHRRQNQFDNKSPQEQLQELIPGVEWTIVPRVQELVWGIQQTRDFFPMLKFDKARCEKGLEHLKAYSRKWSTNEKRWLHVPDKSTGHSEAADALRQLAQAYYGNMLDRRSSWGKPIKRNLKGVA